MRSSIRGLAEVVLLVDDLPLMRAFYERVLGFQLMREDMEVLRRTTPKPFDDCAEPYAFYRIREEGGRHGDLFALFDAACRGREPGVQAASRLDHVAFRIDLADLEAERTRLEGLGIAVRERTFPFIRCRSLFFDDPEGNVVELVADDPEVRP